MQDDGQPSRFDIVLEIVQVTGLPPDEKVKIEVEARRSFAETTARPVDHEGTGSWAGERLVLQRLRVGKNLRFLFFSVHEDEKAPLFPAISIEIPDYSAKRRNVVSNVPVNGQMLSITMVQQMRPSVGGDDDLTAASFMSNSVAGSVVNAPRRAGGEERQQLNNDEASPPPRGPSSVHSGSQRGGPKKQGPKKAGKAASVVSSIVEVGSEFNKYELFEIFTEIDTLLEKHGDFTISPEYFPTVVEKAMNGPDDLDDAAREEQLDGFEAEILDEIDKELQKRKRMSALRAKPLTEQEIEDRRSKARPWQMDLWGDPQGSEEEQQRFIARCAMLYKEMDKDGDHNLTASEALEFVFSNIKDIKLLSDICFAYYDQPEEGETEANGELELEEFRNIIWDLQKTFSYGPEDQRKKQAYLKAEDLFRKFAVPTKVNENDIRKRDTKVLTKDKFRDLLGKEENKWIINFFIHMKREQGKKRICEMCGTEWTWWPSSCVPECARKRGEEEGEKIGCSVM